MLPAQLKTRSDSAEVDGISRIAFASCARWGKRVSCILQKFKGLSACGRRGILRYCSSSFSSPDNIGWSESSLSTSNSSHNEDSLLFLFRVWYSSTDSLSSGFPLAGSAISLAFSKTLDFANTANDAEENPLTLKQESRRVATE